MHVASKPGLLAYCAALRALDFRLYARSCPLLSPRARSCPLLSPRARSCPLVPRFDRMAGGVLCDAFPRVQETLQQLKQEVLADKAAVVAGTTGKSKVVAAAVRTHGVLGALDLLKTAGHDAETVTWCCDALVTLTEGNGEGMARAHLPSPPALPPYRSA